MSCLIVDQSTLCKLDAIVADIQMQNQQNEQSLTNEGSSKMFYQASYDCGGNCSGGCTGTCMDTCGETCTYQCKDNCEAGWF